MSMFPGLGLHEIEVSHSERVSWRPIVARCRLSIPMCRNAQFLRLARGSLWPNTRFPRFQASSWWPWVGHAARLANRFPDKWLALARRCVPRDDAGSRVVEVRPIKAPLGHSVVDANTADSHRPWADVAQDGSGNVSRRSSSKVPWSLRAGSWPAAQRIRRGCAWVLLMPYTRDAEHILRDPPMVEQ